MRSKYVINYIKTFIFLRFVLVRPEFSAIFRNFLDFLGIISQPVEMSNKKFQKFGNFGHKSTTYFDLTKKYSIDLKLCRFKICDFSKKGL